MPGLVSIVAVMGFDWRHVVRSILRIGFRECSSIHLLLPPWDDERSREGINKVREIALAAGLPGDRIATHRLNVLDFEGTVMELSKLYMDLMPEGGILLSLGGGMRILVLEAFTAAVMLGEKDMRGKIRIVVDLEGREESVSLTAEDIASLKLRPPTSRELEAVRLALSLGTITPKTLAEALEIPRSTAHAILKAAENKGMLKKTRWGKYQVTNTGKTLLQLYQNKPTKHQTHG